ncbi:sensor histidine kinase [Luteitalea sp.]|uniref:sensor histidine kinase n=1 Tax=Luteitalea sp. TaxID=2004800 RepID=UPI0037CAFAD8
MTLRRLFYAYLLVLHGVAAVLAWHLARGSVWGLLALEAGLVVSAGVGAWLVDRLLRAHALVRESAQLLEESDYTTRFLPTGQIEIDRLIEIYNRMADALRAERVRVREQHHFLQSLLDVSPSGAVILDHDARVDFVNPAAARLLGPDVRPGLPAHTEGSVLHDVIDAVASVPSALVTLPGGRRAKASRGTFMDRGFSRTFLLIEEMTEELRQAEKAAYEKLIRMLSHEVNNSVAASNSLLGSCLVLAEQLPGEARTDLEGALHVVMNRTSQLGAFMKAFADVVRLPEPRLAPCDLHDLLTHLRRLMAAEADRRRIAIVMELAPVPSVDLDRTLMEQALVNILKNAIEAVDHDGKVVIRTGVSGAQPFLQVEDTGPGLAPEVRAHLFTPFFSTKESGQGIGLTLVQEILTRHGLAFTLDGPDGGPTRFTIWFGPR